MNYLITDIPYFQTPNDIFETELSIYEKMVYIYICRCCNNGQTAFPSYQTIADKCSLSRRKAIDAVKVLIEHGYVIKQYHYKNGENYSNYYKVNYDIGSAQYAPPSECHAPPSAHDAPNKEISINNSLNKNKYLHHSENDAYVIKELAEYCFDCFGKELRQHTKEYDLTVYHDVGDTHLYEFFSENIKQYDQCNLDYLQKIEGRLLSFDY